MKQVARVVPLMIAMLCAASGTSDETVASNVRPRLVAASTLDTSQVTVPAKSQVVTLTGSVATGSAVAKGTEATASGATKLGTGIAGAVTPDKN